MIAVATGDGQIVLTAPEFAKHGYAGVPNQPLSGIPSGTLVATTGRGPQLAIDSGAVRSIS